MLQRVEEPDLVYRTEGEKYEAIVSDILEKEKSGRPTLVGTVSIEKSERLSTLLRKRGIKHVVLNAKYHAQEAEIVAQAGRKGTVTIATNMAGRGTDILLGGSVEHMARQQAIGEEVAERLPKGEEKFVDDAEFVYFFHVDGFYRVPRPDWERIYSHFKRQAEAEHDEVIALGGLHILGTERHEARRIDNQLRGRAGRQGDPGSSRFYLSLEDDLMRIFGSDRISGLMQRLGMEEGVPIEHGMVTRAIERAQKQVEAQNFSVRKHLLEYDDVMNKQRESVYTLRREILEGKIHLSEEEVRGLARLHAGAGRRPARGPRGAVHRQGRQRRRLGSRGAQDRSVTRVRARAEGPRRGGRRGQELRRDRRRGLDAGEGAATRTRSSSSAPRSSGSSKSRWRSTSWISSGRTTSTRSTTSRKASGCAATASAIRWSSTRRRASRSSRTCAGASRPRSCATCSGSVR